jgi:hypothetical protein
MEGEHEMASPGPLAFIEALTNPLARWPQTSSGGSRGKSGDRPHPMEHIVPGREVARRVSGFQEILQGPTMQLPAADLIDRGIRARPSADIKDRALGVVMREKRDLEVRVRSPGRPAEVMLDSGLQRPGRWPR